MIALGKSLESAKRLYCVTSNKADLIYSTVIKTSDGPFHGVRVLGKGKGKTTHHTPAPPPPSQKRMYSAPLTLY